MKNDFLKQLRNLIRLPWWKRIFNFFFRRKRQDISVSGSGTKYTAELRVGDRIYYQRYEKSVEAMWEESKVKRIVSDNNIETEDIS